MTQDAFFGATEGQAQDQPAPKGLMAEFMKKMLDVDASCDDILNRASAVVEREAKSLVALINDTVPVGSGIKAVCLAYNNVSNSKSRNVHAERSLTIFLDRGERRAVSFDLKVAVIGDGPRISLRFDKFKEPLAGPVSLILENAEAISENPGFAGFCQRVAEEIYKAYRDVLGGMVGSAVMAPVVVGPQGKDPCSLR